jgi:hypothetical protein
MNWAKWSKVGIWVVLAGGFLWAGISRLDPDYGWHVEMGKYITESGIPKTDPFSYTMPSYPFVDHEWLMNVILYRLDQMIGKNGLAVIFAVMAIFALRLGKKPVGWEPSVLLAGALLLLRFGVRPQVLDWLLVAVIWRLFGKERLWKQWRWALPVMFVLWTNLHGGFAIGVGVWGWLLAAKTIEKKRIEIADWAAWGLGIAGTLINPYGIRIWWEVGMQITDSSLRKNIVEWQPFFMTPEIAFGLLGVLWASLAWRQRKKIPLWRLTTPGIMLVAGMSSLRHIGIFAIVAASEVAVLLGEFYDEIKDDELARRRAKGLYLILVAIAGLIYLVVISLSVIGHFSRGGFAYPEKAVSYLKKNPSEGNLFSLYGWGGYLIWKYPQSKVFIDGRMPSWRWKAPEGESDRAMEDYNKVIQEADYQAIFAKYNVKTVLFPTKGKVTAKGYLDNKLVEMIYKIFGLEKKESKYLLDELVNGGWQKIYDDGTAVIYEKGL